MKTQCEIRSKILKERAKLNESEVYLKSQIIQNKVLSLPQIKEKQTFFVYNAFKNEVDTSVIIQELKSQNKAVCFPLITGENMVAVKGLTNEFILDKYGIKTPKEYSIVTNVDVAIIPLIACDKLKNRIGFGKGYYDKFLKGKNVLKIGICYDFQVVDNFSVNEWDVPLDIIITETQII